jgi:hypothetical protein
MSDESRSSPVSAGAGPDPGALIDAEHAAFLTTAGVSISVGSRNADHLPNLTRGIGCRIADDRSRVSVFVIAEQSRDLLDDLRANRCVAAVFTEPHTHRTIQLKGRDAVIESLEAGDLKIIERYREVFTAELGALGYSGLFVRTLIDSSAGEVVAVSFSPAAAFSQTPGPKAGMPLREPQ